MRQFDDGQPPILRCRLQPANRFPRAHSLQRIGSQVGHDLGADHRRKVLNHDDVIDRSDRFGSGGCLVRVRVRRIRAGRPSDISRNRCSSGGEISITNEAVR
jgi:hypothetical protein